MRGGSEERRQRVLQKWQETSWTRLMVWVVVAAAAMGIVGYFLWGAGLAVTAALAVAIGLTYVYAGIKRDPEAALFTKQGVRRRLVIIPSIVFAGVVVLALASGNVRLAIAQLPLFLLGVTMYALVVSRRFHG